MNMFIAGGKGLAVPRCKCRGSIPRDTATGKGCQLPPIPAPKGALLHGGEVGVSVHCGAHRPWHKEGDTVVMPWVALGLGEALLGTSKGASSCVQDRLLWSSRHTYSLSSTWRSILSSHAMSRSAVWSLVFAHQPSSAEGTVPTSTSPALVAAPWEGFGGQASVSLVCAHRHPGRMAWHSLVLLPFLLATGKDSSWLLAWEGGRCWSCFQPPILFLNSLGEAVTPKQLPTPLESEGRAGLDSRESVGAAAGREAQSGGVG